MTYNILAPQYCLPQRYPTCTEQEIKWKYRFEKVFDEVKRNSPDLLCIQEYDDNSRELFEQKFAYLQMDYAYDIRNNKKKEGMLIAWK